MTSPSSSSSYYTVAFLCIGLFVAVAVSSNVVSASSTQLSSASLRGLQEEKSFSSMQTLTSTSTTASTSDATRRKMIINGSRVNNRDRYSYYALMNGNALCGAVLIGQKYVLTAAHCAYADTDFEIGTSERGGSDDLFGGIFGNSYGDGIDYDYNKGVIHPGYDDEDVSHDLAIFELDTAVPTSVATPVRLRQTPLRNFDDGIDLSVIGFGDTDPDTDVSDSSKYLQEVQLQYVSAQQCENDFGGNFFNNYDSTYIEDGMMCAYSRGRDSCGGDSGGPLLLKGSSSATDQLVGIVSWGISCADDEYPGVYTRISYYYDWIVDTICNDLNGASASAQELPYGITCDSSSSTNTNTNTRPTRAPVSSPVSSPTGSSPTYDNTYGTNSDDNWYSTVEEIWNEVVDYVIELFGGS